MHPETTEGLIAAALAMRGTAACSSDACAQGKRECPTKAACMLPIDDEAEQASSLLIAIVVVAVCGIVGFFLAALASA